MTRNGLILTRWGRDEEFGRRSAREHEHRYWLCCVWTVHWWTIWYHPHGHLSAPLCCQGSPAGERERESTSHIKAPYAKMVMKFRVE